MYVLILTERYLIEILELKIVDLFSNEFSDDRESLYGNEALFNSDNHLEEDIK